MPIAPSAGCGKAAGLTSGRASIDVNGKAREYILYVPANYDQNHAYKLIFGWHPWGGSAQQTQQMGYFGLQTPSMNQAILVAPEGQNFQDGGLGWGNAGGEDVAFAHAMMDRFSAQLCVDTNRVFSTGFSFGAMFSFTFGCTAASGQRGIAPMAGNTQTSGGCENSTRSVAVMSFVGLNDSLLTVHRNAVQVFVQRNGCSTQKTTMSPSWCDGVAAQYSRVPVINTRAARPATRSSSASTRPGTSSRRARARRSGISSRSSDPAAPAEPPDDGQRQVVRAPRRKCATMAITARTTRTWMAAEAT